MEIGAIIQKGPADWQIIQQHNGKADFSLSGIWKYDGELIEPRVYVRVVKEDTGDTAAMWQISEESGERKWNIIIKNIPSGGLYRIETCLHQENGVVFEWDIRGDMIHHIGVGDVYVISGQSNAAGYGKDPVYDPPEIGVHILKNNGRWDLASHPLNDSTKTIHEENREGGNSGHSPYLSFAKQLKRELGYPIGLIQASLGGSPLSAWNPEEDGILYKAMIKIINSQGGLVKGILWYQGCSDTSEGLADTYLDRFKSMVSHLRKDLDDQNLPILTVQLNRLTTPADNQSNRYWGMIREAQRQAAKQIFNVFIAPASDCTLSDLIHNSSSANMVIGERLSKIALNNIYGKNIIGMAPDLAGAKMLAKDKIIMTFENVYNRLYAYDVGAEDLSFVFEDEDGFIAIKSYELSDVNKFTITLSRDAKNNCMVHGAYEQNPRGIMPIDYATHLPILSFYGVKIKQE